MFIEPAIVGNADVLVSQDEDLLSMVVPGIQVVNSWQFIQLLNAPR